MDSASHFRWGISNWNALFKMYPNSLLCGGGFWGYRLTCLGSKKFYDNAFLYLRDRMTIPQCSLNSIYSIP